MRKNVFLAMFCIITCTSMAQIADSLALQEVVVTGTRNATDVRHLPMTVNVLGRQLLTEQHQTSVLPTVMQQVPGFFVTSRSMMGYGVSTGCRWWHQPSWYFWWCRSTARSHRWSSTISRYLWSPHFRQLSDTDG